MIAAAKPLSCRAHHRLNLKFETKMLPQIRLMALQAFRDSNRELRYELVAEVVARAYAAFLRLAHKGRGRVGYATSLALFSIRQVKSGRRMGATLNIQDITSEHAQIQRRIAVERLDRYDEQHAAWREIIVEDKRSGPAEIVAMRLDFAAWLGTLTQHQRSIALMLSTGETTNATAGKFGVTPSRISMLRRQFKAAWETFVAERPVRPCIAAA